MQEIAIGASLPHRHQIGSATCRCTVQRVRAMTSTKHCGGNITSTLLVEEVAEARSGVSRQQQSSKLNPSNRYFKLYQNYLSLF